MKKLLYSFSMIAVLAIWGSTNSAFAQGWPQNYGGVMLQGFYWDSFDDTQWALLERQADELASTFSLIWIPQSAKAANSTSMGYDPLYWFSNYNSSFGTKEQLVSMIKTFKGKGLGTIADIVINHRSNVSSWVDFPKETYNGVTYELKSTDIVADDDEGATKKWADSNGYSLSSNTEGTSEVYGGKCEGWNGMRDLDHASENVQTNVKAYLGMLLSDEFGYAGFRYDVAKGFPAKYFGIYNNASNPTYSVGEFWDGNATNCKKWVDATKYDGKIQSAVFDFPFRYTVRDAINNNDWRKLGNTSVMADASYRQYAVTFIENHDTEKRSNADQDPIKRDTLAGNAFLLAMPGTPCVFMTHWKSYKQEIKAMIEARKVAGITNTSSYTNMGSTKEYFANIVKVNDENRLLVVVGNTDMVVPDNNQWTKALSGYHYAYYFANTMETAWADKGSGDFSASFDVTLTAVSNTADTKLVYTIDGSEPSATNGTQVVSGSSIKIEGENDVTLKVGMLKGSTVSGIITRTFTYKEAEQENPLEIPSFCQINEGEVCAFFEAPDSWTNTITCWAWSDSPSENFTFSQRQNWPGVDCVKIGTADNGNDVWKWTWDGTKQNNSSATQPSFIIFSNSGSPQAEDYTFQNGGYYTKDGLQAVVSMDVEEPNYDNTIYMDNVEVLSGTEAVLSVKMKNTVVAEGFEFNLYLPEGITVVTDEDGFPEVTLSTERTTPRKTNSFDAILREDGSLRVLGASTNGSAISGNDGEIVQVKVAIADDMVEGEYAACVKDIAISDVNAVSYTSAMTTSTIKVNAYIVGDANKDKTVDVADFTAVAHHLLENTPANFHPKAADANQDEKLDVADLTAIAHLILYGTISKPTNASGAKQFMPMAVRGSDESTEEKYLYIVPVSVQGNSQVTLSIKMKNTVEAEGFGFDLYLPEGMTFATDADGFIEASLSTVRTDTRKTNSFDAVIRLDGALRVLAASTNGSSISGNDGEIVLVTVNVDPNMVAGEYPLIMREIAISDVHAVSHRTDLQESTITILNNGISTNINGMDNLDNNAEWYTLDGKKLNGKPKAKGVYIMNRKKVRIK